MPPRLGDNLEGDLRPPTDDGFHHLWCSQLPIFQKQRGSRLACSPNLPLGVDYVKAELFEVHRADEAIFLLRKVNQALKGWDLRIKVIAAGYADAHKVASLAPLLMPDVVATADADGCLLDTACKGEGHLLRLLTTSQLESFIQDCRADSLLRALPGSLSGAQLPLLESLGVDIVGIRSTACQGHRIEGRIDKHKVRQLKEAITPSVGTFPRSSLPP